MASWRIERRTLMGSVLATAASPSLACSAYPAESGPAYAPWDFPDDHLDPQLRLVHAAILAASPHNTQPWLFRVDDDSVMPLNLMVRVKLPTTRSVQR